MGQTMIALVSEQRMQNIIPFFHRGTQFDCLWLVRSTDADAPASRYAQAWKDTSETLRESLVVNSAEPSVTAYGIAETRAVVAGLLRQTASSHAVVNFTGGTKCMSIGAYSAAQDAKATALYVDTANEKLVWFHPDHQVREEDFDLVDRLAVPIYLRANNKLIDEERTRRHVLPKNAYEAAQDLLDIWPRCISILETFGKAISQGQDYVSGDIACDEIALKLARYDFIRPAQNGWQVTQQGRAFLTGKWLDAMVYAALKNSQLFDDVQSDLCLQRVENELDVLAARRGQLSIVECKSGDLGGQTTLNKLQAIRTGFGTFARTFFVTSREASQVDHNFRERAKEYGVREIVTAETLPNVAMIVKDKMRGTV